MAIDVNKLVTVLAEEFKPMVQEIEKAPETTKGHYGNYMSLIGQIAQKQSEAKLYAMALIEAGANRFGVTSAIKILYGS